MKDFREKVWCFTHDREALQLNMAGDVIGCDQEHSEYCQVKQVRLMCPTDDVRWLCEMYGMLLRHPCDHNGAAIPKKCRWVWIGQDCDDHV